MQMIADLFQEIFIYQIVNSSISKQRVDMWSTIWNHWLL